jgi:VIT1/CCC1 family predicted Fe2+/Mn2+ transporter
MKRVGSAGNYQFRMVAIFAVINYLAGGLMLIIPFLFYQDPYSCPSLARGEDCHSYVCSLPLTER